MKATLDKVLDFQGGDTHLGDTAGRFPAIRRLGETGPFGLGLSVRRF
jgi:hypothetical protein